MQPTSSPLWIDFHLPQVSLCADSLFFRPVFLPGSLAFPTSSALSPINLPEFKAVESSSPSFYRRPPPLGDSRGHMFWWNQRESSPPESTYQPQQAPSPRSEEPPRSLLMVAPLPLALAHLPTRSEPQGLVFSWLLFLSAFGLTLFALSLGFSLLIPFLALVWFFAHLVFASGQKTLTFSFYYVAKQY